MLEISVKFGDFSTLMAKWDCLEVFLEVFPVLLLLFAQIVDRNLLCKPLAQLCIRLSNWRSCAALIVLAAPFDVSGRSQ